MVRERKVGAMDRDCLPTERVARATWLFARGEAFTVRELSEHLAISARGTRSLLEKVSRVVPLVDDGGIWRIYSGDDEGGGQEAA